MTDRASATLPSPLHTLTSAAWLLLEAELDRLEGVVRRMAEAPARDADDDTDGATIVHLPEAQAVRRLATLRTVAERSAVDDDPDVAVIGRRVTLRETDGTELSYALVLPGDGDPTQGWVSADSPLGAAVAGRRSGDVVQVSAPAGSWSATIVAIA